MKVLYHSHLDVGAYFSETDAQAATMGGDVPAYDLAYLVTSVRAGVVDDRKLFVWDAERKSFVEAALIADRSEAMLRFEGCHASLLACARRSRCSRSLAVIAGAAPARADSREVADRVVEQWRDAGGHVTALPPRFLFDDETVVIPVPASDECERRLHARRAHRRARAQLSRPALRRDDDPLAPEVGGRATSVAGVVELRRCGAGRAIRYVVVTSDAGRGALEVVVAHAPSALPALTAVIPERTGGALPPVPEAGALPVLPPPEKRAERRGGAREARRRDASMRERRCTRATTAAERSSSPSRPDVIASSCSRAILAPIGRDGASVSTSTPSSATPPSDRVLARDRTEAPDARLEACVGRATHVNACLRRRAAQR